MRWSNTTPPTRTFAGTLAEERLAGRAGGGEPRGRDVGRLHRARVVHRQHDRRLLGGHRDADLRARERHDRARPSPARRATSGAWRRQPGRRGTTDARGRRARRTPRPPGAGAARPPRRRARAAGAARARAGARATRTSRRLLRGRCCGACCAASTVTSARRRRGAARPRRESPGALVLDRRGDVVGRRDPLAVDGDDHVAGAHAGALRRGRRRSPRARPRRRCRLGGRDAEVGALDRLAALEPRDHVARPCWPGPRSRCRRCPGSCRRWRSAS